MSTTFTTAEARKKLADLVNQVAYANKSVILTRRGEEIAALVSMEQLELLQQIEDFIDTEDAKKSLEEPGTNIPAEKFWRELGI